MARRQVDEINAGSMADIAFLLLIFFLVTTTMEVDAGISRNLPIKRELPPDYKPPQINDRDIFVIMANSNDQLLVEGEFTELEDLESKVLDFYTANKNGDVNPKMPPYTRITGAICQSELTTLKAAQDAAPEGQKSFFDEDIRKWEKRLEVVKVIGDYDEISGSSVIQLKNQAGTTYGLYIEIQDILKKVVNDLRAEKCKELQWGEFSDLDPKENPEDKEKIEMLQVLVPERIIEAKIEQ